MKQIVLAAVLLAAGLTALHGQDDEKKLRTHYQKALTAYQQKKYDEFLSNMKLVHEMRPRNPAIRYNLAGAYALTGNADQAFELLQGLAIAGLSYPVERSPMFVSLMRRNRFMIITSYFAANREPFGSSRKAFTVDEPDLIPAGLAYDSKEKVFFISSVRKRKVVRIDRLKRAEDFISPGQDGLLATTALLADPQRRLLWVCATGNPDMEGYTPEHAGKSFVAAYDLDTGELRRTYAPADSQKHNFNDITLASNGDVYVVDARGMAVYRISEGSESMQPVIKALTFRAIQGITLDEKGEYLFVSDYSKGVFLVELATGGYFLMAAPEDQVVVGIDGLYFYKNSLIGVQNGIQPHRIIRMQLSDSFDRIVSVQPLEVNNEHFDRPALGAVVKDQFYYIANSQMGRLRGDGNLPPAEELKNPVVLRVKLR